MSMCRTTKLSVCYSQRTIFRVSSGQGKLRPPPTPDETLNINIITVCSLPANNRPVARNS